MPDDPMRAQATSSAWADKRDTANRIVNNAITSLTALHHHEDVLEAVMAARHTLAAVQSGSGDKAHLSKSLSRLATAVRRLGFPGIAGDLLDWAIDTGAADAYVFSEAICCRLAQRHWRTAEALLQRARHGRMSSEVGYTSVLAAFSRHNQIKRVRRVFAWAVVDGFATGNCHASVIHAFGRAGYASRARHTFQRAVQQGCADLACHLALMCAYSRTRQPRRARSVFEAARRRGFDDPRLYTTMISIYCKAGQSESAESVFRTAMDAGAVDSVTFEVLATWHARGGAMDRAESTLHLAETRGLALDTTYIKLADACLARNEFAESWELLERAKQCRADTVSLRTKNEGCHLAYVSLRDRCADEVSRDIDRGGSDVCVTAQAGRYL